MKYEYFSLSLISFICGLLGMHLSIYVMAIPFILNILWFTYSMFFVLAFLLFGMFIWKFFALMCFGFAFITGNVVHTSENSIIVNNLRSDRNVPSQLKLRYENHSLEPGKEIKFSCFLYGNYGKIIKVYRETNVDLSILDRIRNYIKDRISYSNYSEFFYSLLLGDRSHMTNTEVLKTNGIIHVFAISGLHVTIILFYVRFITRFLLNLSMNISYNLNVILISNLVAIAFAILYSAISFTNASTLRALVMCCLSMLIPHIDMRKSLIITTFLLLLYCPNYILDPSFQMSCLATYAILSKIDNIPLQQMSVNAILLPFITAISPFSMLLNVVVIPIISLLLLLSFFAIHWSWSLNLLDYGVALVIKIMEIPLPYMSFSLSSLSKILYYLLITFTIYKKTLWPLILGFLLLILLNLDFASMF